MSAVTIKRVQEFIDLQNERRELDRKSRTIGNKMDSIRSDIRQLIEDNKGRPVKKGKFTLSIEEKTGRVSWKQEFVDAMGVDAANKLSEQAKPVKQVVVK